MAIQTAAFKRRRLFPRALALALNLAVSLCSIQVVFSWNFGLPKVSYRDGVLRIQPPQSPSEATSQLPPELVSSLSPNNKISNKVAASIQVRDTEIPQKGFGAFCVESSIARHSFLGFYEGTVRTSLPTEKDKRRDYIMSLDGGATYLDGYERAQDYSRFSPVHLNHADKDQDGCNCIRILLDDGEFRGGNDKRRVAFFTKRIIQVGEELCFEYGDNYWRGREAEKI